MSKILKTTQDYNDDYEQNPSEVMFLERSNSASEIEARRTNYFFKEHKKAYNRSNTLKNIFCDVCDIKRSNTIGEAY